MIAAISEKIKEKLSRKFGAQIPAPVFTAPPAHTPADISSSWALTAGKTVKMPPSALAQDAAELLSGMEEFEEVSTAGPGFINIKLKTSALAQNCRKLCGNAAEHIKLKTAPKGKILLEFVSANPTGPLHIASGRGAALGDSMARIHRALGYQINSEYYVNDAGNQAKLLGASLKARFEGKEPPEDGYQGEYLIEMSKHLSPSAGKWTEDDFSKYAIEELLKLHKEDMAQFRVNFDRWFKESELYKDGKIEETLAELKKTGLVKEKEGAFWLDTGETDGEEDKERVLVRADGRPTYFLCDLAYHRDKFLRGFDKVIDIWGADHHGYVARMKSGIKALGFNADNFAIVLHQFVHLVKDGQKVQMSKRSGQFARLKDLTDDAGADACRFFFAMRSPQSHMTFDIDLAKKRTQENPVFYVQYVHARICSILKLAKEKGLSADNFSANFSPDKYERALMSKLLFLAPSLNSCIKDFSPHHLAGYLTELAGVFHPFYDNCRVLDIGDDALSENRLFLCLAVKKAIAYGLDLLAVNAPEEM